MSDPRASEGSGPRRAEAPSTLTGCAIASPHHLSTEAGIVAFRRGGNAIDAALAAAASLTVTLPDNCALGGDLIALVRQPSGQVLTINASGTAPAAISVDDVRSRHGHTMPYFGPETITVPGLLAGWQAIWSNGARLPWTDAFVTAIEQARSGVPASRSVQDALDRDPIRLGSDPGMRRIFFHDGAPLRHGQPVVQPELAITLETIASEGARSFYDGRLGRTWLAAMAANGSPLRADDLLGYCPEITAPLRATLFGQEVLTAPPNSQGALLLMTLSLIDGLDQPLDPLSSQAPMLATAFQRAAYARARYLADPRFAAVPTEEIVAATALLDDPPPRHEWLARGDTVAVVTADQEGRAVSLIQSLFDSFGAGILDPQTGIIAHNRGTFFSLDPDSPNVLEPGKRPAHTLTPVILTEQGRLQTVVGTMGGLAQTQILTQVLLHLGRGWNPLEAITAPRWTVGGIEASADETPIQAEGRVPAAAIDALATADWSIVRLAEFDVQAGEVQVIVRGPDGRYMAASDPRSEGKAISRSEA